LYHISNGGFSIFILFSNILLTKNKSVKAFISVRSLRTGIDLWHKPKLASSTILRKRLIDNIKMRHHSLENHALFLPIISLRIQEKYFNWLRNPVSLSNCFGSMFNKNKVTHSIFFRKSNCGLFTGVQLGHTIERCLLSFCHWSLSIQSRSISENCGCQPV